MIGMIVLFFLIAALFFYLAVQGILCKIAVGKAYERLEGYPVSTAELSLGTTSFIDEGQGEPILVVHGICGGYDQGYDSFRNLTDRFRLICPSRFGYLGSDYPADASPKAQAQAFAELLDFLGISKVFIFGTSAGATVAIRFALDFPERTKGLVLISPASPLTEKPNKAPNYLGPPKFMLNNFAMWLCKPLFPSVMGMEAKVIHSILPMELRKLGIVNDATVNNTDMARNFDDYVIEELEMPALILQSKDDKLSDYETIAKAVPRFPDCTFLSYESGGHLLAGSDGEKALTEFIGRCAANERIAAVKSAGEKKRE